MWCGEHDLAERECGICQPHRLPHLAVGESLKLRLPSPAALAKAGVSLASPSLSTDRAARKPLLGQVTFNRNALAVVSPLAGGVVESVSANVGDRVEQGALLAVVRAPGVAEAKAAYLDARAKAALASQVYARESDLHARGISAQKDLDEAAANLKSARLEVDHGALRLANLGLNTDEVAAVVSEDRASSHLPIRAPFSGTVVGRNCVPGTRVESGAELFRVADLDVMWMELAVPEKQLANLTEGAPIAAQFEAYPGREFEGVLDWVGYTVDPQTRLVDARAVVPNEEGLLRDGMFGEATPVAGSVAAGWSVPEAAVQQIEGRDVVFAHLADDLFEARVVESGRGADPRTVVLAGVNGDDRIAVSGSYILKSEFLKSKFGAGCAGH
jgi:cobalt-zinc-cadmium efflux system membrane fusion protein